MVALGNFLSRKGGASDVANLFNALARIDALAQLDNSALGISKEQNVGLCIKENRAPNFSRPVVEVGEPSKACFDAANNNANPFVGLSASVRVDEHRAIGACAAFAAWGIGIVVANFMVARVAIDHRVHVAAGDAKEKSRLAKNLKGFGIVPLRLRNNANAKALGLDEPADERHAKARVIDVGIAGHNNDVALVPAKRFHLFAGAWEEARRLLI